MARLESMRFSIIFSFAAASPVIKLWAVLKALIRSRITWLRASVTRITELLYLQEGCQPHFFQRKDAHIWIRKFHTRKCCQFTLAYWHFSNVSDRKRQSRKVFWHSTRIFWFFQRARKFHDVQNFCCFQRARESVMFGRFRQKHVLLRRARSLLIFGSWLWYMCEVISCIFKFRKFQRDLCCRLLPLKTKPELL